MKRFFIPAMLIFAGLMLIAEPMKVMATCGLNPVIYVPGECVPPSVVSPVGPFGACIRKPDGSCFTTNCSGSVWENGIPGRCGSGIITENNVPRCESDFGATVVTIHEFTKSCLAQGPTCACIQTATGATTTVTVCNCRNLSPLH